jgi:dihydropteroate synthase
MLRLGRGRFADEQLLVMAIVNRTPDSFFAPGSTFEDHAALEAVDRAVDEGADLVDIGGVKAGPGAEVDDAEEIRRTVSFVAAVRERHPDLVISVDTWRATVGRAVAEAGADVLNDAWGGWDPELASVAAQHNLAIICTHTGGATPRTRPHRVEYDDVMSDVVAWTTGEANRVLSLGVAQESIVIDPGHDFGKNSRHSIEVTRRLPEMVATGWPVLVSLSRKDFVGEALDLPDPTTRLTGTLATTAVSAWLGARIFRAHDVAATRQTLDMVATLRGTREVAVARRALA